MFALSLFGYFFMRKMYLFISYEIEKLKCYVKFIREKSTVAKHKQEIGLTKRLPKESKHFSN